MKAVVNNKYGPPDILHVEEVIKPTPKENEVLVKVHATSINSWDWDFLKGSYFFIRLIGPFKPKYNILGCDIAGVVESVGGNVKDLKIGDNVFGDISGDGWGGFAEYVCADEKLLAIKPKRMTFEQAASLPQAGVLALQAIDNNGKLNSGQKLLINGAGGGVGTLAIQIAKSLGAEITSVDKTEKLDMLRKIGSDYVIDYTKEDFSKNGKSYDFILDVVGNRKFNVYKQSLSQNGIYGMVGGPLSLILNIVFRGILLPIIGKKFGRKVSKDIGIVVHTPNKKDLEMLTDLFERGIIEPIIDKVYPFEKTSEAFKYFGEGNFIGKIVISIYK